MQAPSDKLHCRDDHFQDEALGIHEQMVFAARHLFVAVEAPWLPF